MPDPKPTPQIDALRAMQSMFTNRQMMKLAARVATVIRDGGWGSVEIVIEKGRVKRFVFRSSENVEEEC